MHRLIGAPLLLAAPLLMGPLLVGLPAIAEEAPADIVSIVTELGPGDLLNIRATPSPIGRTQARLPIGSSVKNFGCNEVNGHRWCKVEEIDNPLVKGWAPARYLIPDNPAVVEVDATPPQATASAEAGGPALAADTPTQPTDVAAAPPATAPVPAASAAPAAPTLAAPAPAAPPLDLTERLGGTDPAAPKSAAEIGRIAMQDAYGLAFAANENPPTGEIPATEAPATEGTETPVQDSATAEAAPDATPVPGIPFPTPRPDQAKAAPAAEAQTVARLEPPPALGATADIPCARYVGQPMTRCAVNIVRKGADKADITVTWPDGGTRTISFYAGMPAGSDSRSDFRFTREGRLSMIRVGVSERFEITDQLALGD